MRILPPSKYWWRPFLLVALILAIAFLVIGPPTWWAAQIRYALAPVLKNRVRDDAGILPKDDESRFEIFLQQIDDESGVDIRFVLVPEVRGESLEDFSVRTARELGVGRDADRRGLLFVYDTSAHRLRIEVGATMEPIITDAFAGYLIREHVRNFFGTGNPSLGLRTTLFIVQHRLRRAVLAFDDDPRVYQFIEDSRRLALGGGASGDMRVDRAQAFLNRQGGSSAEAPPGPRCSPSTRIRSPRTSGTCRRPSRTRECRSRQCTSSSGPAAASSPRCGQSACGSPCHGRPRSSPCATAPTGCCCRLKGWTSWRADRTT